MRFYMSDGRLLVSNRSAIVNFSRTKNPEEENLEFKMHGINFLASINNSAMYTKFHASEIGEKLCTVHQHTHTWK